MTKLFGLLTVVLMISGCKKNADLASISADTTCTDPLNVIIQQHAPVWCTEDMTAAHEIGETAYRSYLSAYWTTIPPTKNISVKELNTLIGNYKCYEKYVRFTFDSDPKDNTSIKPELSDCFDRYKSCYSIPLFQNIIKNNALTDLDVLEYSIAQVDSLPPSVIFAVLDRTKKVVSKRFYDISIYPKMIEKRLQAIEQKK